MTSTCVIANPRHTQGQREKKKINNTTATTSAIQHCHRYSHFHLHSHSHSYSYSLFAFAFYSGELMISPNQPPPVPPTQSAQRFDALTDAAIYGA